jgi:ATP/maltotriose-dependent transcriptional regulator MalT
VLQLAARGRTNSEIGVRSNVGEATVKTYLLRAFDKLGVSDRTAAVVTALERGLLQLDCPEPRPPPAAVSIFRPHHADRP